MLTSDSAIRWVQRFRENGTSNPCPVEGILAIGESITAVLALVSEVSDLTLNGVRSGGPAERQIPGSRSALSRFFARHGITIESLRRTEPEARPTSPARADAGFGSKAFLIRPASYLSRNRAVTADVLRLDDWNPRGERLVRDADGTLGYGDVCGWACSGSRRRRLRC